MTLTALNGRLPDSVRVTVDTGPNGPQQLHADVAPVWAAMLAAGMPAGCLRSGYRTLAQQAVEVDRMDAGATPSALPPGRSQHGEGLAGDLDEPARSWARARAGVYGLRFPLDSEPWHCELDRAHVPPQTTTPPQGNPRRRRRPMHYVVQQTGEHYVVTDVNVQLIQPAYVAAATLQWGEPVACNAADITRLRDLTAANRRQGRDA